MSDALFQALYSELDEEACCPTIGDLARLFGCEIAAVHAAIEKRLEALAPGYSIELGRTRVTLDDHHLRALLPLPAGLIGLLESA